MSIIAIKTEYFSIISLILFQCIKHIMSFHLYYFIYILMIYYITYITYFIPIEIIDIIAIIDIISLPCRTPCRTVPWNPLAFKTYCGTIPMPTSWQTTSCIRPRIPPGGRQAHLESDCVGSAELFWCHRQEPPAVTVSKDNFNGDDIENWILVVELV